MIWRFWVLCAMACDNGAMDGFFWAEWPYASHYHGELYEIHTPNPNPSEVHTFNDSSRRLLRHKNGTLWRGGAFATRICR